MLHRLRKETSGWYKKLLTYLVESPEDADVRTIAGLAAEDIERVRARVFSPVVRSPR